MPRILVVDDQKTIVETCRMYLEHAGFEVDVAYNGMQALEEVARAAPDAIVLDLLLPRLDGREVCRRLRADGRHMPVIMLSALATEDDRIAGLELGADDYLVKPFSPRELVVRVRTILRRVPPAEAGRVLRFEGLEIDRDERRVFLDGAELTLSPREFGLLAEMAQHPFRAFTRADLIVRVFGDEAGVLERTVDAHIMNLRRRIEPDPAKPARIVTVYGVGYRFEGVPCG
ncbi:MAG: response regulator transcription factor [Candidatus Eisenbacteria bacterium]